MHAPEPALIAPAVLGLLLSAGGAAAGSADAGRTGRRIFGAPIEAIERCFGPTRGQRESARPAQTVRILAPEGLRQALPGLPESAQSGVTIGADRRVKAVWLAVDAMVAEARSLWG